MNRGTILIATLILLFCIVFGLSLRAQTIYSNIVGIANNFLAPIGATQIQGNATGSTSAVVGTLTAVTGKTTYICGFDVSAIGGTAAVGPITIAGLLGGSQVYQLASTASGNTLAVTFNPCLPASATATNITVTTTADGTATAVDVNSWGFNYQ